MNLNLNLNLNLKRNLFHNLNNSTYCRLKSINQSSDNSSDKISDKPSKRIGIVAIKPIPINTNPFELSANICPNISFVKLNKNIFADPSLVILEQTQIMKNLYEEKSNSYYVPYHGLNSTNICFYIHIDPSLYNLVQDLTNAGCLSFRTTRNIEIGEELVLKDLDLTSFVDDKLNMTDLIDNLKKTYCTLRASDIEGVGVYTIKQIATNTNPFELTNNSCYNYNGIFLSKTDIKRISNIEVKKMIKDFISPDSSNQYMIPYGGLNSINLTFFLNHSTTPNLEIVSDGCEYMGFITKSVIEPNTELTINYGDYKSDIINQIK